LIFETLPGNAIKAGDSFVVIDNAEGTGITGEFATLDAILPSNLTAFIQYTSNQVIVVIAQSNCLPCAIQDCFCPPLLSSSIT
jgi:hypothetical protein